MHMKSLAIINILSVTLFCFYVYPQKPENLTLAKQDVELYYESPSFNQEAKEVLDQAWLKLRNIVPTACRSTEIYEQTAANLKKVGYHTFERIILRTQEDTKVPFYAYKKQKRYDLANEGYEIVACVGDQWSDLEGEHTGIKIKLPNYILYE